MRDEQTSIGFILTQWDFPPSALLTACPFMCWSHESFRVKVTIRKTPGLVDGGLLKGVVATSKFLLSLGLANHIRLYAELSWEHRAKSVSIPSPKAPQSESDFWWLSKKRILGKARWCRQPVVFRGLSCEPHNATQSFLKKQLGCNAALYFHVYCML